MGELAVKAVLAAPREPEVVQTPESEAPAGLQELVVTIRTSSLTNYQPMDGLLHRQRRDQERSVGILTLGQHYAPLLDELIALHRLQPKREHIHSLFNLITIKSLSLLPQAYSHTISSINGDGVPLQISITMGKEEGGLRLLTEAGPLHRAMKDRIKSSTHVLCILADLLNLHASATAFNAVLLGLLPSDEKHIRSWRGVYGLLSASPNTAMR